MASAGPYPKLSLSQVGALLEVAARLDVPAEWLYRIIDFESAGTWDPKIRNKAGSSARGLIQFMDSTAKGMGYAGGSAQLVEEHPTVESQLLGPVYRYLSTWKPFKDRKDFYFSIFLPKYRKSALTTVIYADEPARQALFRRQNPGIKTVGDYYARVQGLVNKAAAAAGSGAVVIVALGIVAVVAYRALKG